MKYWLFGIVLSASSVKAQKVNYDNELLGTHLFSLHWISLEYFGNVTIKKSKEVYTINGQQGSKENADFVRINGIIKPVSVNHLQFEGRIVTRVGIWGSDSCVREGVYNFKVKGTRRYWRLVEMDSPCNTGVDYIDIFFKR